MYKIFIIIFAIIFAHSVTFACRIFQIPTPPLSGVSPGLYVIEGEVIGYTEKITSRVKPDGFSSEDKFMGEGRGFKIKPLEIINAPGNVMIDYFEYFTFGVTSWCAPKLQDAYLPVGTKIRFVAVEAELLPNRSFENRVRLQKKIFDRLSVINIEDEFESETDSEFDYENRWKSLLTEYTNDKNYEKIGRFDDFIFSETVKDVIRLKNAIPKNEKYKILERLIYNPKVDFPALVSPLLSSNKLYYLNLLSLKKSEIEKIKRDELTKKVKLTKMEKNLIEKRLELEKSEYFHINIRPSN